MDSRRFASVLLCAALVAVGDALVDITIPSNVITFTATPMTVIPRKDTLYLNCTYTPPADTHELASLTTMVISKYAGNDAFGQPIFNEVTAYNEKYGFTTTNQLVNEQVIGQLNPVTQSSYLDLVITGASRDQIGRYQCEANIMSIYGHPETLYKEITVAEGVRTCTAAEIYQVEDQLDCTQQALFNYVSGGVGVTWLRNLFVNQNFFYVSSDFGNPINPSRYYLFSLGNYPSADEGEGACQALGGYLAEIDDLNEFNFITSFTQQYQVPNAPGRIQSIYLGARDDRTEGQWYYRYSGKSMPNLGKFVAGEPNGGTGENCLVLWYYAQGAVNALGDNACNPTGAVTTSFLCEVPNIYQAHYSYTTNAGITCSYP